MDTAEWNLKILQGARFETKFTILDEDGQPLDLTGYFIEIGVRQGLMVRDPVGIYDQSSMYVFTETPTVRLDPNDAGAFYWKITGYETGLMDWFTRAYYDVVLTPFTANNAVVFENGTKSIPNDGTDGTNMTDALGEPTQTIGTGLDDFSYTGPWTGTGAYQYECRIFSVGAQDTFEWRMHDGSVWSSWDDNSSAGYNCQPAGVTPAGSLGIKFIFSAITGHTDNDVWTFYVWDGAQYLINAFDESLGTGSIYPSTVASNQRTFAKNVKPFRNYKDWLPYHGPMYVPAMYTPGVSYPNDLSISGHLSAAFAHPFYTDVQWDIQVDGIGTPNTYRWRINAGGSGYGSGIDDYSLWISPGTVANDYWGATGVAMSTSAVHLAGGVMCTWGATTGHQLYDHWFFRTRAPLISIVNSSNNNNGLYRLSRILSNGEGLEMRTSLTGILGTGLDSVGGYDSNVSIKRVALNNLSRIKPLRGGLEVVPLLAHWERYLNDRYPTTMGY